MNRLKTAIEHHFEMSTVAHRIEVKDRLVERKERGRERLKDAKREEERDT